MKDLEGRVSEIRRQFRPDYDPDLPQWTPEQWVAAAMIKLGEASYHLHAQIEGSQGLTDGDRKLGAECLLAIAAVCLDAVEALESHGKETAPAADG